MSNEAMSKERNEQESSKTNLSPIHLAMLRNESGISDDVIMARGYRTIEDKNDPALEAFARPQRRVPGLLLPLHTTDGEIGLNVYRPDSPRVVENKRKKLADGTHPCRVLKYEIPKGAGTRVDCSPVCQPKLADPSVPLWITEGQKKGDALVSRDLCAVSLLGVWSWKGKNEFKGVTFLADFDHIALKGREVRIVFDSDASTNENIRASLVRFTVHLQSKGAHVTRVYLPGGHEGKVGVDDWLVEGHTVEELKSLRETPRPAPKAAPEIIKFLDEPPLCMRKPLTLADGQSYAAAWPYCQVTRHESLAKNGDVIKLDPPEVVNERRLVVVRGDGKYWIQGMNLDDVGLEVNLPELPPDDNLWTKAGLEAYAAGRRADPLDVFKGMVANVDHFLDFNCSLADQQTMCEMVACYAMSTWFLDAFNVAGYLYPNGPRGSGKTKFLHTVTQMCYLGTVILAGGSYASLRDMADYGATLAFDDAENLQDVRNSDPDKRTLLLAGNRRNNFVTLKEPQPDKTWKTRRVSTFCHRLFSAIKQPDDTLASRTIVIPLVLSMDPKKANSDPTDVESWTPEDRHALTDDLWSLALEHLPEMGKYNKDAALKSTLMGRNLEPWRGILTMALWLDAHGTEGLWDRMDELSLSYQESKGELAKGSMESLVLKAICANVPLEPLVPLNTNSMCFYNITVEKTKTTAQSIAADGDPNARIDYITNRSVGRSLASLGFDEVPRPGGKGSRIRQIGVNLLKGWLVANGIPIPASLSFNGTTGTTGTTAQPDMLEQAAFEEEAAPSEESAMDALLSISELASPSPVVKDSCDICDEMPMWSGFGRLWCQRHKPTGVLCTLIKGD